MEKIVLPEIVAAGIYNTDAAVKNRTETRKRRVTMPEIEIPLSPEGSAQNKKDTNQAAAGQTAGTAAGTAAGTLAGQHEGQGAAGTLAGSLANSGGSGTSTRREAEQAAAETALETLTGMLDTLTGTPASSEE